MIFEIFRFELREQLKSPLFWLVAGLFALLGFALMSSEAIMLGGGIGDGFVGQPVNCFRRAVEMAQHLKFAQKRGFHSR